jgi:hypothetical protein
MLMYTAEMKNPITDSIESKRARVEAVIEELGLSTCRDVVVGTPLHRGISGEWTGRPWYPDGLLTPKRQQTGSVA